MMKKNPSPLKRRKRRSTQEVKRIRDYFLSIIQREGKITLTDLIGNYGSNVNVGNTASDKNLVKRQLDQLAAEDQIRFRREGRDLVARLAKVTAPDSTPEPAELPLREPSPAPGPTAASVPVSELAAFTPAADLTVIRAYARQLEEFSKTLQEQISTLVRMVEKATQ